MSRHGAQGQGDGAAITRSDYGSAAERQIDTLTDDDVCADWLAIAERMCDEAVHLHWNRRMYPMCGSSGRPVISADAARRIRRAHA